MSKVSVFDREWIDLVFEGRNKEYGAYQLRKESPRTTIIALFSGIALVGILVAIPAVLNHYNPAPVADTQPLNGMEVILDEFEVPEAFEQPKQPEPEPVQPEPEGPAPVSSTATVAFRPIEVTNTTVEPLPVMDDFTDADPGAQTTAANPAGTVVIGTSAGTGPAGSTGTGTDTGTGNEPVSSFMVDESPVFMNGMDDFYRLVGERFEQPDTNEKITLKVLVSFIVEKDGTMSNIKVLKDPGYGIGREAIRVLKSIKTKWKPGKKGGKEVRTAYSLPIAVNVK